MDPYDHNPYRPAFDPVVPGPTETQLIVAALILAAYPNTLEVQS